MQVIMPTASTRGTHGVIGPMKMAAAPRTATSQAALVAELTAHFNIYRTSGLQGLQVIR